MPELPEVETTRRGIQPHIIGKHFKQIIVRNNRLRWPVHPYLNDVLYQKQVDTVDRRAKYLLIHTKQGYLIIHLGMSGSLRVLTTHTQPEKHDHIDFIFEDNTLLRYRDPRRFGAVLWYSGSLEHHPLFASLGVEPLSEDFNTDYLYTAISKQKRTIKNVLMDNRIVVGVGNIYSNESLFQAAILPTKPANQLQYHDCERLVASIQDILQRAILAGGSSLKDFVNSDGNTGYFQQHYTVYGRYNQPCLKCSSPIKKIILGQRSSFYCPICQQ